MDTEKAKVFLAVLNEGSLSAAAEQLGYTTSGVSRSIASLEEETGVRLFTRSRSGMAVSAEAAPLIPILRELVHQEERYRETADRIRGLATGKVTIGVSYAGYFKIIADRLKVFTDRFPGIRIETMQATSTELLHAMEDHEADLAIMTYRDSKYLFRELRNDPMVACLPENHPMAEEKVFPMKAYETESFIAPFPDVETDYSRSLEKAGVHPNIQYTTTDIYAAYCMIEAGLGVSLLNKLEIESFTGRVKLLPTDPEIRLRIGVMYPEPETMTAAAREFITMFQRPGKVI